MKPIAFFILLFPVFVLGQGVFTPVSYNDASTNDIDLAEYIGQGKAAILSDGEVYELNFDSEYNFSIKFIENTGLDQDQIVKFDLNKDGSQDLLTLNSSGGNINNYLFTPDRFDYVPSFANGRAFTSQDFNDDGIDEVIIDGYVYHYNIDGSLERIFRRTPANDYFFKNQYVMDVDQDDDLDILVNLGQNIGVLVQDSTDILELDLISQFNESVTWMRVLETNQGPVIIYYNATTQKIRRIIPDNGFYTTEDLVSDQPNFGFDTKVADLDGDGNQELLITNSQIGSLYILAFDPISGEVNYQKHNPASNQQFMIIDDLGDKKLVGVSSTTLRVYSVDSEMNLTLEKSTISNMNLGSFIDLNGDGFTDIVNGSHQRRYFGNGNFSSISPFSVPEPGGTFIDFDDDGDADYVLDEFRYENLGEGDFGPAQPNPDYISYPDPDIFFTNVIYEGDLDKDGDIDLISYNIFGEPLLIHENVNNEYFLDEVEIADNDVISGDLKGIRLMDLDGDLDEDILMISASGMVWFRNDSSLQFAEGVTLFEGVPKPISFDIDDVDKDGFPDILLDVGRIDAGTPKGETYLYKGSTSGPTYASQISSLGGYKYSKFIEYDNTGIKDILMSDGNFLQIIRLNTFEDSFPLIKLLAADFDDFGNYIVKDVDNDGDDDVIVYGGTALRYYLKDETDIDGLCPFEDVIIYNQEQLEKYRQRFGSCTELPGSLFVGGENGWSDITDLSPLNNINKIEGNLTLKHLLSSIENFEGLSNLDSIGGGFTLNVVRPNSLLGFRNLKTIGGSFIVDNMFNSVTDFEDLFSLEHIGGGVEIRFANVNHLDRLFMSNKIGGKVSLTNLEEIQSVAFFEQIDTILGDLEIKECSITNLSYLKNIKYLTGVNIRQPNCEMMELNLEVDSLSGDYSVSINSEGDFAQKNNVKYIEGDFSLYVQNGGTWNSLETVGGYLFGGFSNESENIFGNLTTVGESFGLNLYNKDDYSDFSKLENIGDAFFIDGTVKSLNGLQALDSIGSFIRAIQSPNLVDITDLSDDLFVGEKWSLGNNPNLNVCDIPALCRHIEAGKEVEIFGNASQCDDISDVKCVGTSITGTAFFDFNQDGILDNDTDAPLSNISIRFDNNSDSLITSENGFFQRFLQEGDAFNVSASALELWNFTTPDYYSLDSFSPNENNVFDFGFFPSQTSQNFNCYLNSSLFLCDRPFEINASIQNTGSNISNGYIKIVYSQELELSPDYNAFTTHDLDTKTIIIDYDSWYPYFTTDFKIPFIAPGAEELDNDEINIRFEVIDVDDSGVESLVKEEYINLSLLCSYDPNDKLVSSTDKSGNLRIMEPDDELIYTIRFQNTGNYFAEDVRITDFISEDLDLSTFTYLSSSHDVEITMREREVTFMFEDIFLIDSTSSYLESQGFVSFSIKPYVTVLDDEFYNQAKIYFDFNDPIITNIAESRVYDPSVNVLEVSDDLGVIIYPQPANNLLNIDGLKFLSDPWTYSITNMSGNKILDSKSSSLDKAEIDLSMFVSGVYLLQLRNKHKVINKLITIVN